jgi:hypothetical protein
LNLPLVSGRAAIFSERLHQPLSTRDRRRPPLATSIANFIRKITVNPTVRVRSGERRAAIVGAIDQDAAHPHVARQLLRTPTRYACPILQFCENTRLNGVPLMVVAKNVGHTDTHMVEKHYGHLVPGHVADAIRAGAPKFGIKPEKTNVKALR